MIFAGLLTLLFFVGWGAMAVLSPEWLTAEKLAGDKLQARGEAYLELLRRGDEAALQQRLGGPLAEEPDAAARILERFPATEPIGRKLLHVLKKRGGGSAPSYDRLVYELHVGDRWLLTALAMSPPADGGRLVGVEYRFFDQPYPERAEFGLAGKSFAHYLFLALTIGVPLFILGVLWLWARTPVPGRAWLWGLFICVGVTGLRLNWDTGAFATELLSVKLLGASAAMTNLAGHWVLEAAVPVGAIAFLVRRREWRSPGEPGTAGEDPQASDEG